MGSSVCLVVRAAGVRRALAAASALLSAAIPAVSWAAPPDDPFPRPTIAWGAAQLVPSPQWLFSERGADFGLRWQLTPFLYSWGVRRELRPFRLFVVEPLVRQSGSIELFVSPEYLAHERRFGDRWGARLGVRAYFPVLHNGEYLSWSLGAGYLRLGGEDSAAIEGGVYVLYGGLGLQVGYSPSLAGGSVLSTLRVRYF